MRDDEKLDRLLQSSRAALPELEADPYLPGRIQALARERAGTRGARTGFGIRWARVSLGTAALTLALVAGGYVGYRAGEARVGGAAQEVTAADTEFAALETFTDAWSQSGFADEIRQWETNGEVVE